MRSECCHQYSGPLLGIHGLAGLWASKLPCTCPVALISLRSDDRLWTLRYKDLYVGLDIPALVLMAFFMVPGCSTGMDYLTLSPFPIGLNSGQRDQYIQGAFVADLMSAVAMINQLERRLANHKLANGMVPSSAGAPTAQTPASMP